MRTHPTAARFSYVPGTGAIAPDERIDDVSLRHESCKISHTLLRSSGVDSDVPLSNVMEATGTVTCRKVRLGIQCHAHRRPTSRSRWAEHSDCSVRPCFGASNRRGNIPRANSRISSRTTLPSLLSGDFPTNGRKTIRERRRHRLRRLFRGGL